MLFFRRKPSKDFHEIQKKPLPVHIGIIPDGNGRWAQKRGLPRKMGHREGTNSLRKVVKAADRIGIRYLTLFAFSTENWVRPQEEVSALMDLLLEFLKNADKELAGSEVRIRVIGDLKALSVEMQEAIVNLEEDTKKRTGLTLVIALNYGGRNELVHMVKKIAKDVQAGKTKIEDIDEKIVADRLFTVGIPDPDLIIRTSGENRASNFLLWQSAYAEFYFPEMLWPDFKEEELVHAIEVYQNRNRRFGGV